MKKLVFILGLCVVASTSFAQKKAVREAKSEQKSKNFDVARTFIKDALTNSETANQVETWFVAGTIENDEFDGERMKMSSGEVPNKDKMYSALDKVLPYLIKADSLDMLPDAKGKVKSKYRKDIKSIVWTDRPYYVNAASYFYEKGNYQKAYENFRLYSDIPQLKMFEGDTIQNQTLAGDSLAIKVRYYAAVAATEIPNQDAAIELFEEIKPLGFEEEKRVYLQLASLYHQKEDTVNFVRILTEGVEKYPEEPYFIQNLINVTYSQGKFDEVEDFLKEAIAINPNNPQFYDILGLIYENKKDIDSAIAIIKQSLDIDPNFITGFSHLGRIYYNLGVDRRSGLTREQLADRKIYEAEIAKVNENFRQAIPYFEKVRSLDPQNKDAIFALRNIYYSLGMNKEYDEVDKIYNDMGLSTTE